MPHTSSCSCSCSCSSSSSSSSYNMRIPRISSKMENLCVESDQFANVRSGYTTRTAHTVDKDSWQQVGLLLVTSFNCAYVLSFSNLLMVPLGWTLGIPCLLIIGGLSFYANWLLAGFQVIDETKFIRYRDIMGFTYGRKMYYLTWILQFLTLILSNMGFILLGGRALKELNTEFCDSPLRLQVFILITGFVYFLFAYFVPTISDMRNWLAISAVLTTTYIVILLSIVVKDGKSNKAKDYLRRGNEVDKVFNAFGAIAATLVSSNSGLLLEIQSTLREPAKTNMRKALASQFSFGIVGYYGVSVAGYWAYGSSVSEYLPKELSGPKWARILINLSAFLQNVISQHMFISPVHEALDTKFLRLDEKMTSKNNLSRLFLLRAGLFGINTLIAAAFPFMGDFINFLGSFALFALVFTFPSMIFIKVRAKIARRMQIAWHWTIIVVSSLLSIATTASAVRLIVNNGRKYRFFADT